MKIKPYLKVWSGKIVAGTTLSDDEPRADMYWPAWLLSMGMLLVMFGAIAGVVFVALRISVLLILMAVCALLMGIAAVLCWKNQTIHMLPDGSFAYTTLFGKKKIYRFEEIREIKNSLGSMTLIFQEDKICIDSYAILSPRLSQRLEECVRT